MNGMGLPVLTALFLAAALAPLHANSAQEPSVGDIMEKNFFVTKVRSAQIDSTMILINDKGQTRERKSRTIAQLMKNGIESKLLVKFNSPADIKGTGFLQLEHTEGDDDLWIYLPALKKSRRLVANNKKDSFVGSDFSYGDILLPRVDSYRHRILRSDTVNNQDCYVIESVPKDDSVKSESGYSKKITWVRKDNFLENKVEYFDVTEKLLKTQIVTGHKLVEPDTQRWLALHREMTNHLTEHKTVIQIDRIETNTPVADNLFTTRHIERE